MGYSDSSDGIGTRYGLDGPEIESRCGRDIPHPSIPALKPTQHPVQWVSALFPGVKRPGRGVDHAPLSSVEVKERVELYIYSPSGSSWPVLRQTFTNNYNLQKQNSANIFIIIYIPIHFMRLLISRQNKCRYL